MGAYRPLKIAGFETGLVQSREEFILPNDAYPTLENAFVWRERIKRKQGYELLGRLRRTLTTQALGSSTVSGTFTGNIKSIFSLETNADIQSSSITISDGTNTLRDANGDITGTPDGSGTINYANGDLTLTGLVPSHALTITFSYYPQLPVMGLRSRELASTTLQQLVAFDQVYAYIFNGGWEEFLPGTTWSGTDFNFFWSTNYWVDKNNVKIFWVTNFSGPSGDPIRYTNGVGGTNWINFAPTIDAGGDVLAQCLIMLPFRGRMLTFNTYEGANLATSVNFPQRIRWAAIGNPFSTVSALVTTVNIDAWRDDIPGQGGFLDIPTSEDIVTVGFVRDNLVVYCENSTWQLRYTGRSIAPFQIEKINSELGSQSTFSGVQFDTSLTAISQRGITDCDSFKSVRIDPKIPDLTFNFNFTNNGEKRVHGIRDFEQKLAYWTYPNNSTSSLFPDRRLVYNYENKSWAIFTDSLTTLGTYQDTDSPTWENSPEEWQQANFPWLNRPPLFPSIVGGNQQGFVEYLDSLTTNDPSLVIDDITGLGNTPTIITSINHNLQSDTVISISGILGTDFTSLNDGIFGIDVRDADNFLLYKYRPETGLFDIPQTNPAGTYIGGGVISVRDGFKIVSKKFNFLDAGQNIQIGFIDILMDATSEGEITLNLYNDYNNSTPINQRTQNLADDTFFNQVVSTASPNPSSLDSTKYWHRVFCASRAAFLTIEWTLSNAQLVSPAQESDVQIDCQILYTRSAGRHLPIGV